MLEVVVVVVVDAGTEPAEVVDDCVVAADEGRGELVRAFFLGAIVASCEERLIGIVIGIRKCHLFLS